jgi:hypothetical protein
MFSTPGKASAIIRGPEICEQLLAQLSEIMAVDFPRRRNQFEIFPALDVTRQTQSRRSPSASQFRSLKRTSRAFSRDCSIYKRLSTPVLGANTFGLTLQGFCRGETPANTTRPSWNWAPLSAGFDRSAVSVR